MKIFGNKKATEITFIIVTAIIALIVLAILVYYSINWISLTGEKINETTCRTSVELRSQEIPFIGQTNLDSNLRNRAIPLKCKTVPLNFDKETKAEIESKIADKMKTCWYQLGRGQYDFFLEDSWYEQLNLGVRESSCVICNTISFSKDLNQRTSEIEIGKYLQNTPIPELANSPNSESKQITYIDYFANLDINQPETTEPIIYDDLTSIIDTSKDYAIVFKGFKGGDTASERWQNIIATGVGSTSVMVLALGSNLLSRAGFIGLIVQLSLLGGLVVGQTAYNIRNDQMTSVYCPDEIERSGCYVLAIVPIENMEKMNCKHIESIP